MLEAILLGAVQGIVEWLPVSSEGMIVLIETNFFDATVSEAVRYALFLHLGTVLAALVYFRSDIIQLLGQFRLGQKKGALYFYITATIISGLLGVLLLRVIEQYENVLLNSASYINGFVALLLLVTAYLQLSRSGRKVRIKKETDLNTKDGLILGLVQGCATLPGISRSGSTVAGLLLLGYSESDALKTSFILSIPIVIAGNILLNLGGGVALTGPSVTALITAFIFGYATIKVLLAIARSRAFGVILVLFALLLIASAVAM